MGEFVRLEVADGIGTIRLDRPKMNALNLQVQTEIEECAREATLRDDVAAVIVYGGERVFAAGADIKEMQSMSYTDMAVAVEGLHSFTTTLARMPKPSVANARKCPRKRSNGRPTINATIIDAMTEIGAAAMNGRLAFETSRAWV